MSRGGETTVCVEAVSAHRGKWLGGGHWEEKLLYVLKLYQNTEVDK